MKLAILQVRLWFLSALVLSVFMLFEISARADALDHWTPANVVTNSPQFGNGMYFTGVAYGNGRYVAVASGVIAEESAIELSDDGMNWSLLSRFAMSGNASDITFQNGIFVAVGGFGFGVSLGSAGVLTSSDGSNWTAHPIDMNLNRVIYGGGLFTAVGSGQSESTGATTNRSIFTSPDGITWTAQNSGAPANDVQPITDVAYGAPRFLAIDSAGHSHRSLVGSNGASWVRGTNSNFNGKINFANGLFIAPSGPGINLLSTNGANWGLVTNDTGVPFNRIIYAYGYFLAISDAKLFTSTDGTNWIPRNFQAPPGLHLNALALGNRKVVVAGYILNAFNAIPTAFVSDPIVALETKGPSPGQLSLSGLVGRTYSIEYITDLRSNNWQPATAAFTLSNSPSICTDPQATNSSRFYRAVLLP